MTSSEIKSLDSNLLNHNFKSQFLSKRNSREDSNLHNNTRNISKKIVLHSSISEIMSDLSKASHLNSKDLVTIVRGSSNVYDDFFNNSNTNNKGYSDSKANHLRVNNSKVIITSANISSMESRNTYRLGRKLLSLDNRYLFDSYHLCTHVYNSEFLLCYNFHFLFQKKSIKKQKQGQN